jgi:hypothetical protein
MTIHELDMLLIRIRDGEAGPEDVERARALVQTDSRLPEELREIALVEDIREDAVALLAVLGHDDGFGALMSEAIMSESFEPVEETGAQVLDLNEAMEAELSRSFDWPLAEAIAFEAGQVELVTAVFEVLGIDLQLLGIGGAIADEAGAIDVSGDVSDSISGVGELGLSTAIGDAIRASAGDVGELWPAIAREIAVVDVGSLPIREALAHEAGDADLVRDVMEAIERESLGVVAELPAPANTTRWGVAAVIAFAAAAMVMFGVRLTISELPVEPASPPLQFASAAEVVVHDLEYSDNVQVFQVQGDEGAMIIWVEEEAVL